MKPCLATASSYLVEAMVGVDSVEGIRRMAMVGGICRDERIIVDVNVNGCSGFHA